MERRRQPPAQRSGQEPAKPRGERERKRKGDDRPAPFEAVGDPFGCVIGGDLERFAARDAVCHRRFDETGADHADADAARAQAVTQGKSLGENRRFAGAIAGRVGQRHKTRERTD